MMTAMSFLMGMAGKMTVMSYLVARYDGPLANEPHIEEVAAPVRLL
jgi:hypothetical protein